MHNSVRKWVKSLGLEFPDPPPLLVEIGARNVNGSVRDLIPGLWTGVDLAEGPGVDVVADGAATGLPYGVYDGAVCTETLEHALRPWEVVYEMARLCHRGGLVLVTCRGFNPRGMSPYHEHPADYWRFTPAGVAEMFTAAGVHILKVLEDPQDPGVFAYGYTV